MKKRAYKATRITQIHPVDLAGALQEERVIVGVDVAKEVPVAAFMKADGESADFHCLPPAVYPVCKSHRQFALLMVIALPASIDSIVLSTCRFASLCPVRPADRVFADHDRRIGQSPSSPWALRLGWISRATRHSRKCVGSFLNWVRPGDRDPSTAPGAHDRRLELPLRSEHLLLIRHLPRRQARAWQPTRRRWVRRRCRGARRAGA